ncbi:SOS response-associated peptidase [Pokkaliibacter sp. CJK22405]|uniref:SOS response-associated peptidase n=1 Tax=Pokkaliibacter sp. CJK22405 TaxID=3384615 RepID=UPI0039848552
MTGRVAQQAVYEQGWELRDNAPRPLKPSPNIAPHQWLALIRQPEILESAHWGLAPSWISHLDRAPYTARADQLLTNGIFKKPVRRQRALIPVDGIYEWIQQDKRRWPVYISSPEQPVLYAAALWETYKFEELSFLTCALISTRANAFLSAFLTRMPVFLTEEQAQQWLDPDLSEEEVFKLLQPWSAPLQSWQVTPQMNSPDFQSPECIQPIGRRFQG